jgi:hypothetical protein
MGGWPVAATRRLTESGGVVGATAWLCQGNAPSIERVTPTEIAIAAASLNAPERETGAGGGRCRGSLSRSSGVSILYK